MLVATVVLVLLPAYVAGQLMSTEAKCLSGYEWTFNTLNQGPCDVAASLAAVCAPDRQFNLDPLPPGYVYSGPRPNFATRCRCNTVYYSMLSACAYCQSRNFVDWSDYSFNCTTVFVQVYPETIPSGVKVSAWAYLNVVDGDRFNVTRAQQTRGTESSRLPSVPSSAATSTPLSTALTSSTGNSRSNVGAIVGGVVGGVVGLALIVGGILFYLRWKRLSEAKSIQQPPIQTTQHQNPYMGVATNTFSSPLNPGSPGSHYSHTGDGMQTNYVPQSPFAQSLTTNFTGNSVRPALVTPVPTGYTAVAEL